MMAPEHLVLALDVGGSSVKSALVADGQGLLGSVRVDPVESGSGAAEIFHRFAVILSTYLEKTRVSKIAFAFPGPFDYERGVSWIQNQAKYDALYGLDIGMGLRELLGAPALEMRFRNDAEAAILGEALHGAGAPYARLLGITLGTGLGSAFIAEGKLITEGIHIPPHGWLYSCMFEDQRADDVFSTRGLIARLRGRGVQAADIASALHGPDSKVLTEVFTSFGRDLGAFLKPFVSDFSADAVLVTGGIASAWERFAPSLIGALPVPVLRGTLGTSAALLGAAALYF